MKKPIEVIILEFLLMELQLIHSVVSQFLLHLCGHLLYTRSKKWKINQYYINIVEVSKLIKRNAPSLYSETEPYNQPSGLL